MDRWMNTATRILPSVCILHTHTTTITCITVISLWLECSWLDRRASGQLMTPAKWMRNFVQSHPSYKQDSIISHAIACDLMTACQGIGEGTLPCLDILGDIRIERYVSVWSYSFISRLISVLLSMMVLQNTQRRCIWSVAGGSVIAWRKVSTAQKSSPTIAEWATRSHRKRHATIEVDFRREALDSF